MLIIFNTMCVIIIATELEKMCIMKNVLSLSLLLFISSGYAASEVTYLNPTPQGAVRIGEVSFFKAGSATQSEVIGSLSKKADSLGGTHFEISSLNSSDNTYATAIVYK